LLFISSNHIAISWIVKHGRLKLTCGEPA